MQEEINASEVLRFAQEYNILSMDDVLEQMNKKKREELLKSKHTYKIWQIPDGRWRTYVTDEQRANKRRMVTKTSKTVLEKFLIDFYELEDEADKSKKITLKMLYPEWMEYKRLHTNAESYIMRISSDWKTYYQDTDIVDIPIYKLDKLTLDTWAHKLIKDYDMCKNKYYNVTVIMRQALLYAVDKGIISQSPFAEVKIDGKRLFRKVRKKPDYTQVFTKEEVQQITELAWLDFSERIKLYQNSPLALLFMLNTGVRIGEVCVLKYSDIESENSIHIQRMLRRDTNEVVEHPKSDCGDRIIPLTSTARKIIEAARERQNELQVDSEYIFSIDGRPIPERAVSTLYTKYCKKMGIIQKSSHKARKTVISELIDAGLNINTVRALSGHADERTTYKNYVFDRSTDEEKLKKMEQALAI